MNWLSAPSGSVMMSDTRDHRYRLTLSVVDETSWRIAIERIDSRPPDRQNVIRGAVLIRASSRDVPWRWTSLSYDVDWQLSPPEVHYVSSFQLRQIENDANTQSRPSG